MSKFEKTRWAENEFSKNYRDDANIYLPFRSQFVEITKSFYGHFISQNTEAKILDLGCGDGQFIQELLKSFTPALFCYPAPSANIVCPASDSVKGKQCVGKRHYQKGVIS
jgi:SAM-dependent methyltransferase